MPQLRPDASGLPALSERQPYRLFVWDRSYIGAVPLMWEDPDSNDYQFIFYDEYVAQVDTHTKWDPAFDVDADRGDLVRKRQRDLERAAIPSPGGFQCNDLSSAAVATAIFETEDGLRLSLCDLVEYEAALKSTNCRRKTHARSTPPSQRAGVFVLSASGLVLPPGYAPG